MDHVLRHLLFIKAYLDDVIIVSEDHAQQVRHLRWVFEVLRSAKLRISAEKYALVKEEIIDLGYSAPADRFMPVPHRIKANESLPHSQFPT